jgi:hypothetical protein
LGEPSWIAKGNSEINQNGVGREKIKEIALQASCFESHLVVKEDHQRVAENGEGKLQAKLFIAYANMRHHFCFGVVLLSLLIFKKLKYIIYINIYETV